MALALEARAMKDDMMLGDTPKAKKRRRKLADVTSRGRLWKHSTLADIDGLVPTDTLRDYFCFAMVRNPWDRVVSYYHWLRSQTFDHPAVTLAQRLTFQDFVCHDQTQRSLLASPARHYVTDAMGRERPTAFVRLENLKKDLTPVEQHLGFSLTLGKVNKSERTADWRSYYDDRSVQAVSDSCHEDISRFGYTFDPRP